MSRRDLVLQALRHAHQPMTVAALAEDLDVHPNTIRFHLKDLTDRGLVERTASDAHGPGRPADEYQAVERMDPGGPHRYRVLAEILGQGLAGRADGGALAEEFGRSWGVAQAGDQAVRPSVQGAVRRLHERLDGLGFAPEPTRSRAGRHRIALRHCPFLAQATDRPEVVCAVHLGLLRGLAEGWQAPVEVESLQPFVRPDLCEATLVDVDVVA